MAPFKVVLGAKYQIESFQDLYLYRIVRLGSYGLARLRNLYGTRIFLNAFWKSWDPGSLDFILNSSLGYSDGQILPSHFPQLNREPGRVRSAALVKEFTSLQSHNFCDKPSLEHKLCNTRNLRRNRPVWEIVQQGQPNVN